MIGAKVGTRLMALCASQQLTIAVMILFALGTLAVARHWLTMELALGIPLTLFCINLLSATLHAGRMRNQIELLIFHWSLLALILLATLSGLHHMEGWVRLSSGEMFEGKPDGIKTGPWHKWHLDGVRFMQGDFTLVRGQAGEVHRIDNQVFLPDAWGNMNRLKVTGETPMELQGYRFLTTRQWGFAPILIWIPLATGEIQRGAVQMPTYPGNPFNQVMRWTLPGTERNLWLMLEMGEIPLDPEHVDLTPQYSTDPFPLIVRNGEERMVLLPGESIHFAEGSLTYETLSRWMGYQIMHDPFTSWLLAASLTAMGSLGAYYWFRFRPPTSRRMEHC